MTLLQRWRQVHAEYRQIKSLGDDYFDLMGAYLVTFSMLAFALGIAAVLGGCHG